MSSVALVLLALPLAFGVYAYVIYPALLYLFTRGGTAWVLPPAPETWPEITITLPVYNEEAVLRKRIENLLALDYPADRRHLLVLSDASTDNTDAIALEYADRGVELLRLPKRLGKSAAENAALPRVRGNIVVNVDATTRIFPNSLKSLVRAFGDPTVGVASGRDVSERAGAPEASSGESGYVGYEMSIRRLETQWLSIVGASGCFYGIRKDIYDGDFPLALSRDFASALIAREHGFRAVSVDAALCGVPSVSSLQAEYKRKIRTMHRGLETLWFKRHLMNPFTHGRFAFMLLSHKLARWLVYPALIPAGVGLLMLSMSVPFAWVLLLLAMGTLGAGLLVMRMPPSRALPRLISLLGFIVASNIAGLRAWLKVLSPSQDATWEPTRRPV